MAFNLFFVVMAGCMMMTEATCPRGCRCEIVFVYGQQGSAVDCSSSLFMEVFPTSVPTNVLQLDFSHNSLDRVPNGIRQLPEMRQLNLSSNRIHYPIQNDIFENNVNLLVLDLSSNKISSFSPNAFIGLGRLEVLDIHNNLIVSFPMDVLQPLPVTLSMCIGNNHWDCSCDMFSSLIERFLAGPENASISCSGGEPECRTPPALYGKLFSKITGEEEMCGSEQPDATLGISTATVMTEDISRRGQKVSTSREPETTERNHIEIKNPMNPDNNPELDLVVQKNEAVVQNNPDTGLFLTKEIVTYGVIVLGAMVLLIFLLLAVVFSRTMSKRRLVETVPVEESKSQSAVSPWPLLQAQRRLPEIVSSGSDSVQSSDYQEIPAKFQKWDDKEAGLAEEERLPGDTEKVLYTTRLGDDRLTPGNTYLAPGTCTDAYIPMRASVLVKQTDLYSPMESQN